MVYVALQVLLCPLCEKVLKYEIRIQFFETKIAELSQQFKIPQKLRTPQHLSQTDFNTLHILGLSIQQVQALPSVGLTSFALFNLFSCLVMITHLLLFQTASEWGNLYPAYIECSLFFLICFCAGIMFRATRVTRRIDEVLWSIGAILGLILAFGSVPIFFFRVFGVLSIK